MLRTALDRALTPRAILCAGWVVFVIYAYPGYMTYDSAWQLEQARHLAPYSDWHPPMMAVLWRITDCVIAGPFPMLVLQSTAFLLGSYGILRRAMSARAAAVIAALALLMPQNITVLAVIWKDSQMAGYLLLALALLLSEQRAPRLVGYFFIWLATAMRYNAAAAAFPIVVLLFAHGRAMPWWRRYALGIATSLGLTALALAANRIVLDTRTHVWEASAAPVEIAGIVTFSPELDDAELRADTPGVHWIASDHLVAFIREHYSPSANFMDITQPLNHGAMDEPKTEDDFAAIAAAWKTLVVKHPGAFLHHRVAMFEAQIRRMNTGHPPSRFTAGDWAETQLEHRAHHAHVQRWEIDALIAVARLMPLPVWLYLAVALLALPLCRGRQLPLVLLSSALLHELGVLMVAPAIDYRYSHWMVITTMLAVVVLIADRFRRSAA